jgi:Holliday junction resolvase RusA-like endonuclease
MTEITLTIPGEPKSKQRPRWHKGGTYTPKETVGYETYIKELFVIKYPDFKPLETALRLQLAAYLTIPKSQSQKKKTLMESNDIRPTKKPDLDNIVKILLDALEKIAFKNDNQFVIIDAFKFYSKRPRLEIEITEVTDPL